MKMKKIVSAIAALSLVAALAVGGTLAWLTGDTEIKTNTFTYQFGTGAKPIDLTIEETFTPNSPVTPGAEITKTPVLTVKEGSVKCYVYAKIDNQFGEVATLDISSDWTPIEEGSNIYRYKEAVDATSEDQALTALFTKVVFSKDLTDTDLKTMINPDAAVEGQLTNAIVVQGFAVQSEGDGMTQVIADGEAESFFNPASAD